MTDTRRLSMSDVPEVIGRYELVRTLGETQLGSEYLATFTTAGGLPNAARLLVLSDEFTPNALEAFGKLEAVLSLTHGAIVRPLDAGTADGYAYVAYEYQPGRDLSTVETVYTNRFGPLPLSLSVHVALEILSGLRYAIRQKRQESPPTHGRIGPEAIFLTSDGLVKLYQLGLSQAFGLEQLAISSELEVPTTGEAGDAQAVAFLTRELVLREASDREPTGERTPEEVKVREVLLSGPLSLDAIRALTTSKELFDQLLDIQKQHLSSVRAEEVSELLLTMFKNELERDSKEIGRLLSDVRASSGVLEVGLMRPKSGALDRPHSGTLDLSVEDTYQGQEEGTPPPDTVIAGRYKVIKVLGRGGMGNVLEVEHLDLGRRGALKILHPQLSHDKTFVERFRREARAACKIGHPNIVDVLDFGRTTDGRLFYVMDLIEGGSVHELIEREGAIEQMLATRILLQVCDAFDAAHEVSVVHRDLKPDNLMLSVNEKGSIVVRVVDFGIAQDENPGAARVTKTGQIFGTPAYMSTEQVRGKPTDHRTDIYSAGSILYELLTGRPVFESETVIEVMSAHLKQTPVPPTVRAPDRDIHPMFDDIVERALQKLPEDRYQSMADLASDLWQVQEKIQAEGPRGVSKPTTDSGVDTIPDDEETRSSSPIELGNGFTIETDASAVIEDTSDARIGLEALAPTVTTSDGLEAISERQSIFSRLPRWATVLAGAAAVAVAATVVIAGVLTFTDGSNGHVVATTEPTGADSTGADASPDGMIIDADGQFDMVFSEDDSGVKVPRRGSKRARERRRKALRAAANKQLQEAQSMLRQRRPVDAAREFRKVLARSPSNSAALAGLGQAEFEMGQHTAAARHLKRAVKLRPSNNRYRLLLAGALRRSGQTAAAKAQYREVLKRDPDNAVAKRMLER